MQKQKYLVRFCGTRCLQQWKKSKKKGKRKKEGEEEKMKKKRGYVKKESIPTFE